MLYFMLLLLMLLYCGSECAVLHGMLLLFGLFYCRSECVVFHAPTVDALILQE